MSIGWTLQPQDEAIRLDVSIDFRLSVFSIRRPVWLAVDMRDSLILGGRQADRQTQTDGDWCSCEASAFGGQRLSVSFFDLEDGIMG